MADVTARLGPSTLQRVDGGCERRGCPDDPAREIVTEAPTVADCDHLRFRVCEEHARVAVAEFHAYDVNILAGRALA